MFLDADCVVCDVDERAISVYSAKLLEAVTSTSLSVVVGYVGLSATELLRGATGLTLSETSAICFLKQGVVRSLVNVLARLSAEDQLCVIEFIWTITNHPSVKENLCQMPELLDALNSLTDHILIAKCALLKIQDWNKKEGRNVE